MTHQTIRDLPRRSPFGFSLIETLVCVVIISILSLISIVSYQGALDQADLKYAAPAVTGILDGYRREAESNGSTITVDFHLGTSQWEVTKRRGADVQTSTVDIKDQGLIKRRLQFLRYDWPDGTHTPTTFTFISNTSRDGGTVYFGTGKAETSIRVIQGHVWCDLGSR